MTVERLRVMQVVHGLNPGGTERLVIDLVSRLSDSVDSVVCCLDERGRWGEQMREGGVPVYALSRRPGFHPALGLEIGSLVRRHKPDVLHCHHYSPFVYGAIGALTSSRCPVIFTEHGRLADQRRSRKRRLANAVLTRLPNVAVYAVSEDVKRHLAAEGVPARRVTVILNGIDPGSAPNETVRASARVRLGLRPDEVVVGTAARLDPVKDLNTLLRAVAAVNRGRKMRLVVFGDGEERQALEQLTTALDLAGRVCFAGYRSDVRELLPALDIYANSSISEGVSLTILEAMAAALPVVATRVGGTPEVMKEGVGILVTAGDPFGLGAALRSLADCPALRKRFGEAARRRVVEAFSIDRMVADYLAVYTRLAEA